MKSKKICILILSLFLIGTALFGLIGCGESEGDGGGDTTTKVSVTFDLGYAPTSGTQTKLIEIDPESTSYTLSGLGITSSRIGYTFLGFYDSLTGGVQIFDESGAQKFAITSNITLFAHWEILTYQKTFASETVYANVNSLQPIEVSFGKTISSLPVPTVIQGYDFIGWSHGKISEGGVMISDGATVKSEYKKVNETNASLWLTNSELYAVVDVAKLSITLIDTKNEANNEIRTYNYNSEVNDLPVLPNDEDNRIEFIGWSTDLYTYTPYTEDENCKHIRADQILYAFYYEYKILEFYPTSSNEFVPVKIYNSPNVPFEMPDIQLPGRRLVGWYKSRLFNTNPIQRIPYNSAVTKYYGKYELVAYTINFNLNGGSVVYGGEVDANPGDTSLNPIAYDVESEISLPILEKERFTFKGWYRNDDETKTIIQDVEPGMYGDTTLVAKFEGDKVKVVYHPNQGNLGVTYKDVEYYADYQLDLPVSETYGFSGWYLDENLQTQLTNETGKGTGSLKWTIYETEVHVYAKFLEKRYITVTGSHIDAGTVELEEFYVEGQTVSLQVVPYTQYTVEGIMINGVQVTTNSSYEFTMPASDVMLKVLYKPATYTVTLQVGANEYCSKETVLVSYGELFTLPVAFKENFRFIGWEYSDGTRADILTNADGTSKDAFIYTENLTLTPFYVKNEGSNEIIIKDINGFINMKDNPSATYQLVTNLNLAGRSWTPFDFSGTLNGNGYTVSNFSITADEGNLAMFGKLSGKVDGLTLTNINITSYNYNGVGIAGICYNLEGGTISNCTIESGKIEGEVGLAGGFATYLTSGTITNCVNKASVSIDTTHTSDSYAIGGIVGFAKGGTVTNCENHGTISGAEFVGGIIGRTQAGDTSLVISHLSNYGNVTGSDSHVAGIVGKFEKDLEYSITNLYNSGKVEGVNYVGGLMGVWENIYYVRDNSVRKVIANAFENSGTIIATGNYVGGLLGCAKFEAPYYDYNYSNKYDGTLAITMRESKNTGEVSGNLYVGGLFGYGYSDSALSVIEDAINNSKITAVARLGAIAGELSTINLTNPSNLGSTIISTETSIEGTSKYVYLGGYVGKAVNTNIENATNNSEINYSGTSCEGDYVGGIAGWSSGTFTDCKNTAKINAPKSNYVGGICGDSTKSYNYTIKGVINSGDVIGSTYVAGIFGRWYDVYYVTDSSARVVNAVGFENSGKIKGSGNYVGGLMGYAHFEAPYYDYSYSNKYNGTLAIVLRSPKNLGDVEGNLYVGGLVGKIVTDSGTSLIEEGLNSANIKATAIVGCIAGETTTIKLVQTSNRNSTITATGTYDDGSNKYAYIGGYIGYAGDTHIEESVNDVEINYSTVLSVGNYVGGFTGWSSGTYTNCINNATIYAPKSSYVGGISGDSTKPYNYTIDTVKNTADITGVNYVAGIFGRWYNVYYVTDNNARTVTAISFENSGNIKGTGNYVGGLLGYSHFEAPYYDYSYSNKYNGTISLVMKTSSNTGNVEGAYYVGGIAGRIYTDGTQSNIIEATSQADIKAVAVIGGLFGEANGVTLTATSNEGSTVTATGTLDESTNKYAYFGGYIGRAYNANIIDSVNNVVVDYSGELCTGLFVGGFCGYSEGLFTNVTNNATVYAPYTDNVGGIAGKLNKAYAYTIENVTNTANVTGKNYVAGLFGSWINEHYTTDNSVRTVNANNFTNTGDILGSGNYVGGLMGYVKFEAPYYDYSYSNKYNGQQMLYMKEAVNSGNVQGVNNVGGLMGYFYSDCASSQLYTCTQTGTVTGETKTSDLIGEVSNLILPSVE